MRNFEHAARKSAQATSRQSERAYSSKRVGDVRARERVQRQRAQYRRYILRIVIVVVLVLGLLFGTIFVYRSDLFHIDNVKVNGVSHLTSQEITSIAAVSDDSTLLRLDASGIVERLEDNAWIQSATVHRVFPDTVEIDVVECEPGAVVHINDRSNWVISSDGTWLSAATQEDLETAMLITDVSTSLSSPVSGTTCTDGGVVNALEVLQGISDELKSQITSISASSSIKTSLNLSNGVTVAFGDSSDVELKEAVINQLLETYSGTISYINVRAPSRPTFRTIGEETESTTEEGDTAVEDEAAEGETVEADSSE